MPNIGRVADNFDRLCKGAFRVHLACNRLAYLY